MIIKNQEIYARVSENHNIDCELVESVGDFVLAELVSRLDSPTEISYELPKLGHWNLRRGELMKSVNAMTPPYKALYASVIEKLREFKRTKVEKRKQRFEYVEKTSKSS